MLSRTGRIGGPMGRTNKLMGRIDGSAGRTNRSMGSLDEPMARSAGPSL